MEANLIWSKAHPNSVVMIVARQSRGPEARGQTSAHVLGIQIQIETQHVLRDLTSLSSASYHLSCFQLLNLVHPQLCFQIPIIISVNQSTYPKLARPKSCQFPARTSIHTVSELVHMAVPSLREFTASNANATSDLSHLSNLL